MRDALMADCMDGLHLLVTNAPTFDLHFGDVNSTVQFRFLG